MYETYLDDSGTSAQSEIAVAACYVSTESGWRRFVSEWDTVRIDEGFDTFHMADFVAKRAFGREPWCHWNNTKKDRVFQRLAKIINDNTRIAVGVALPKAIYDAVPQRVRDHYGNEHYTFAVRMCMMHIHWWRQRSLISQPMQYIFDWEEPRTSKFREITELMTNVHEKIKPLFGLDTGGFSFQRKEKFKPLQAADILAWEMNAYMPKIYPQGETEGNLKNIHPNFRAIREHQEITLGFYTQENLQAWLDKVLAFEAEKGIIP